MKCIVTHNITGGDKYVTTRYELTNHLGNVMAVISDAPSKIDEHSDEYQENESYKNPTVE